MKTFGQFKKYKYSFHEVHWMSQILCLCLSFPDSVQEVCGRAQVQCRSIRESPDNPEEA